MRNKRKFLIPLVLVLLIFALMPGISSAQAPTTDLIITGVIDGPLTGGIPKAVEFYALNDIADLSVYGFGSANNGGGSDGQEFTFPADSVSAGTFIYVATETTGFNTFFGFDPTYTNGSAPSINGDDAIELFKSGAVVDVFGDINVDGTGEPWEYKDGWAYRVDGTGPDGSTFVLDNWFFSGPNALDNETSNATAATPFPIGTFGSGGGSGVADFVIINELDADQASTDSAEFIELYDGGVGNTDLSGLVLVLFNGSDDASYDAFDLDGQTTTADGYFVICGNAANVPNCNMDVSPDTNLIQNGADAAALYIGDAADFPNDTPVTTDNLLDAIVYDTDDGDDAGLLVLLNAGQPQVNERGGGDGTAHSNQRCPNGEGGARNTETYTQALPTPGEANNCGGGGGGGGSVCGAPATFIHDIQGNGLVSPMDGATGITIEGVVVGDYQDTATELRGFYVQEEDADADADPATSEGIFVFDNGFGVDVNAGDVVRVTGNISEYYELTELGGVSAVEVCSSGASVTPATVSLPIGAIDDFEAFESMLVNFPQQLTVTEHYNLGRYGQVDLATSRLFNPTQVVSPGTDANLLQDLNDRSRIILDDANTAQNRDPIRYPAPGLSADNTLRTGYTVDNFTGVMDYRFGAYRLQPVGTVNFNADNPRTPAPENVGGTLKVASFNVLNYFNGDGLGGGFPTPRGADTPEEFTRQRDKIINAILALDADVVGLMEIENDGFAPTSAIADLVNGLNAVAGAGTYAYIDPGVPQIGTDEIAVGLIFKPASVTPMGAAAILDSSVDPTFIDTKNRPSLAQTFLQNGTPEKFTVVVNHLKSKGSPCDDLGDPNTGDGQGNCNLTRTAAANALVNWLAGDPTDSGDPDFLLIGDMNSYAMEDPITAFKNDGMTNLSEALLGTEDYSYVFAGQFGTLDYALSSGSLTDQVSGVTHWHINSDEPRALDYNEEYKSAGQIVSLYSPKPYRASDHDPVLVGLNLDTSVAQPGEFVALATDGIWLRNGSTINSGLVGNNDVSDNPLMKHIYEVFIGRNVSLSPESSVMGNRIFIDKNSTIFDAYYNLLDSRSAIQGNEFTPVRMPLVNSMPVAPAATPGTDDVMVDKNDAISLDAGDYAALHVRHGGSVTFTGGVYNFSEWRLDHNVTITFAAPTEIRIAGRLLTSKNTTIMPADGLAAHDVTIFVLGENGNATNPRSNPRAATFGLNSVVHANVYAPNGTLWLRKNAEGTGAFIGKWVLIDLNVSLTHDSAF